MVNFWGDNYSTKKFFIAKGLGGDYGNLESTFAKILRRFNTKENNESSKKRLPLCQCLVGLMVTNTVFHSYLPYILQCIASLSLHQDARYVKICSERNQNPMHMTRDMLKYDLSEIKTLWRWLPTTQSLRFLLCNWVVDSLQFTLAMNKCWTHYKWSTISQDWVKLESQK